MHSLCSGCVLCCAASSDFQQYDNAQQLLPALKARDLVAMHNQSGVTVTTMEDVTSKHHGSSAAQLAWLMPHAVHSKLHCFANKPVLINSACPLPPHCRVSVQPYCYLQLLHLLALSTCFFISAAHWTTHCCQCNRHALMRHNVMQGAWLLAAFFQLLLLPHRSDADSGLL